MWNICEVALEAKTKVGPYRIDGDVNHVNTNGNLSSK